MHLGGRSVGQILGLDLSSFAMYLYSLHVCFATVKLPFLTKVGLCAMFCMYWNSRHLLTLILMGPVGQYEIVILDQAVCSGHARHLWNLSWGSIDQSRCHLAKFCEIAIQGISALVWGIQSANVGSSAKFFVVVCKSSLIWYREVNVPKCQVHLTTSFVYWYAMWKSHALVPLDVQSANVAIAMLDLLDVSSSVKAILCLCYFGGSKMAVKVGSIIYMPRCICVLGVDLPTASAKLWFHRGVTSWNLAKYEPS